MAVAIVECKSFIHVDIGMHLMFFMVAIGSASVRKRMILGTGLGRLFR
tara:strand:- start:164 stop:307 length:144 start_codon:yes stop_codon:yes gene_type:complete